MKKIAEILIKVILFFMMWLLGVSVIPIPNIENPAIWRFFAELFPLLVMILVTVLFWLIQKKELKMGLIDNWARGIKIGSVVGIIWILVPVFNVLTMSVFMTFLLEWSKSIWAPIIAHYLWNAVGSLVFNGVLLADDYPHILNAVFIGNDIVSGGVCRLEGSILVLIVNSIFCIMIGFLSVMKTKRTATRHVTDTVV